MRGGGGGGEGVNVRNLLRPWCVFYIPQSQNIKIFCETELTTFFVFPYISKIKQIINYLFAIESPAAQ